MPARRRQPVYRYTPAYTRPGASRRRRRRSRTAGRIRLGVLLAFIAAAAALVVVASSSGSHSSSAGSPRVGAKPPATASPASRHASHPSGAIPTPEARDVQSVLSYTPFVKAGLGRHRVVALTFDDGPSPYTARIVAELARLHVPATFFVVGQQLDDFAGGVRDEVRHGFAVGDHTENHANMTQLSAAGQYKQVHDAAVRLERVGAPAPVLFRPPYGFYDGRTLGVLRQAGMLMTLWSADTRDWTRPGTAVIIRRALSTARPGGIILMHDGGGNRSQTVAALPAIVNALRRRHYGFVTVPQLVRLDPPPHNQQLPHVSE